MNFLSSAFSSLTGSAIPYTFKDKIVTASGAAYPDSRSVWNIYNGVNPKNDTLVSIFEFSLKDPATARFEGLARNAFKKLKLIKFPGVISAVDFIENDSYLYIITERVVPLVHYLNTNADKLGENAKLYGIYNVTRAMLFVNMKAQCLHGKLDLASSVFVNSQGEWKLFGFETLTNLASDPDQPIYRLSQYLPFFDENQPEEVVKGGIDAIRQFAVKYDSYRLGIFIYSVLTASDFRTSFVVEQAQALQGNSRIPKPLSLAVKRLLSAKSNLRITVDKFAQETESYFSSNVLVRFSKLLEEVNFLGDEEKLSFFKNDLANYIDGEFPPGFLENKLLPDIVFQFNALSNKKPSVNTGVEEHQSRQETISVLLNYILKLGVGLSSSSFSKQIKPVIFHSFTLLDRSVRLTLLKYLPDYCQFLTDLEVQSKVFYNLITGFQDTNFLIRETTLTSITSIIDKVSDKQVNQDLLKVLAKLQMDPKPSIRTNTLILIIKISSRIYTTSRNNVVITALAKSLKDSFTPCKLTALSGFEKLKDEFSLEEICAKILGHLAVSLMDNKSYKVRQEAKRVFELYLNAVEKHASSLPKTEGDEDSEEREFYNNATSKSTNKSANAASGAGSSVLSFGWVVNKLVSTEVQGEINNGLNASTPDLTRVSTPKVQTDVKNDRWTNEASFEEDDQWGSDDLDSEVQDVLPADQPLPKKLPQTTTQARKLTKDIAKPASGAAKKSGLQVNGTTKRTPGSTLNLNLTVDDDTWGEEW